ncbi:hypothetical protein HYX08_03240 [Candidatus Woesearchaeota archaeon]|nr:hypothetical protein [Candidatus Woesearchaeota archaeon]
MTQNIDISFKEDGQIVIKGIDELGDESKNKPRDIAATVKGSNAAISGKYKGIRYVRPIAEPDYDVPDTFTDHLLPNLFAIDPHSGTIYFVFIKPGHTQLYVGSPNQPLKSIAGTEVMPQQDSPPDNFYLTSGPRHRGKLIKFDLDEKVGELFVPDKDRPKLRPFVRYNDQPYTLLNKFKVSAP